MTYDQTIELADEFYNLRKGKKDSLDLWDECWAHLVEKYGLPKYPETEYN